MDEIQRKLELFDKRLAGRWVFHKRMVGATPLFFCAAGLIFGICLQRYLEISVLVWLILLLLMVLAAVSYSAIQRRRGVVRSAVLAYAAMLCAVCLGAVRLASYRHVPASDISNFVGAERVLATIRGRIVAGPYTRYKDDWAFARFSHSDPSSSFYIELREAEAVDGWEKVGGKIRVVVDELVLDLKVGDYIEAYCWLSRFRGARNPGQFDLADFLGNRNVYVGASVKSREGIKLLSEKKSGTWAAVNVRFREIVSGALLDEGLIQERQKGLLEALLLGYRGNIDADVYRAFEKTGLLHFISLSGMHLGILAGLVWWLAARVGLLKPARALVCILVVAMFLVVVPPRAPTIRAAVICVVFCLSILFRRHPNPLNSLSIAAIVLLLLRPTTLFEAGWQLSFACVLGILMFCKRFYFYLKERVIPESFLDEHKKSSLLQRSIVFLVSLILAVFSTGLTGWLGGAGILLYHFYSINPLASVWTVIAFPLVACILWFGFLKILISFFLPSVSSLLAVVLNFLSMVLIRIVEVLSRFDVSEIHIGQVSIGVVLLYYSSIAIIAWAWYLRPLARKAVVISTVVLMAGAVCFIKWQRVYPSDLRMSCLDVGHGQAIVVQSPEGTLLFDAGSQYNRNIGQRIITPFLRSRGIDGLNAVIISHDDVDHINGIVEVVKNFDVDEVYTSAAFIDKNEESGTAKYLADCLNEEGIKLKQLDNTIAPGSQVQVDILWPDEAACSDESLGDNDKSVVALIGFAGRRILLCADIESFAQQQLLERYDGLQADIVVVPHHGSVWSGSSDFLSTVGAKYLICSCGQRHFERVKSSASDVLGTWFYTARDGAIRVRIDKGGRINVRSY